MSTEVISLHSFFSSCCFFLFFINLSLPCSVFALVCTGLMKVVWKPVRKKSNQMNSAADFNLMPRLRTHMSPTHSLVVMYGLVGSDVCVCINVFVFFFLCDLILSA